MSAYGGSGRAAPKEEVRVWTPKPTSAKTVAMSLPEENPTSMASSPSPIRDGKCRHRQVLAVVRKPGLRLFTARS